MRFEISLIMYSQECEKIGREAFTDCDNLTLIVPSDSYAERYCKRMKIPFTYSEQES